MESDVIRLYSSSPPPLDEDEDEEDEDDFGEFGGYSCSVSSSFSFPELDPPNTFGKRHEADSSPTDLHNTIIKHASQPQKSAVLDKKEPLSEQLQEKLHPETRAYQIDGAVDCINKKPEAHDIPVKINLQFTSQQELSDVSDTRKKKLSFMSAHQDLEPSSSDKQRDSAVQIWNGIETALDSRTDTVSEDNSTESDQTYGSTIEPNALLVPYISQREVAEPVDSIKAELYESSNCSTKLDCSGEDVMVNLGGSMVAIETAAFFCETQKQNGSTDVADFDTPPALVVDPISDSQISDNSEGSNISELEHIAVDGLEDLENFGFTSLSEVHGISDEKIINNIEEPTIGLTINVAIVVTELVEDGFKDVKEEVTESSVMEIKNEFGNINDSIQLADPAESTRDDFADFVTALSGSSSDDEFGDLDSLKDLKEEAELEQEEKEREHKSVQCLKLPPSDSFADFTSASFGSLTSQDGEGWTAFGRQEENEEQLESWAVFDNKQQCSSTSDAMQTDSVSDGLSPKLQHLFESTFPSEITPEDNELQTLCALLQTKDQSESRGSTAMWNHLLDVHNAHGLKVQWVGSRSNRILLDCLGIHNILFTGQNKKPMIVPMFAAGLGMLEPTKDPVKPAYSASSPSQRRSTLCTQVMSSLSISEDGTSQRRASFSLMQSKTTRHSRQKSYS